MPRLRDPLAAGLRSVETNFDRQPLNLKIPMGVFSGARGDGSDEGTLIAAYVAEARSQGRPLYAPAGTYRSTVSITGSEITPVVIFGDGPGLTILETDVDGGALIDVLGTIASGVTVTVASAAGDSSLTITSTVGLAAGDYVALRDSTQTISGDSGNTVVAVAGEVARIKSVDSGTALTFHGRLEIAYTTAATLRKLGLVDVTVANLTIRNPNPGTMTPGSRAIHANYVRPRVSNVDFEDLDDDAMRLTFAIDFDIGNCNFRDLRDTEGAGTPYSIAVVNGCDNGLVHDCRQRYGRHMFTTLTNTDEIGPAHIKVSDCIGTDMSGAVYDTHQGSRHITFENCTAHTTAEQAFQIRSKDTTVINPIVSQATRGVAVYFAADRFRLSGGRLKGCDICVFVDASSDVTIEGVDMQGTVGVRAQKDSDFPTMTNLTVRDCDIDATTPFEWPFWHASFKVESNRTPDDGVRPSFALSRIPPATAITETLDRDIVATTAQAALTSGRLLLVATHMVAGMRVAAIRFLIGATSVTATNLWFALYDKDLNLLGVTADNGAGNPAAGAALSLTLASPVVASYTGLYYVGAVSVAATPVALRGLTSSSNTTIIAPIRAALSTTGLTNPASVPDPAGALTADGRIPYAYLT